MLLSPCIHIIQTDLLFIVQYIGCDKTSIPRMRTGWGGCLVHANLLSDPSENWCKLNGDVLIRYPHGTLLIAIKPTSIVCDPAFDPSQAANKLIVYGTIRHHPQSAHHEINMALPHMKPPPDKRSSNKMIAYFDGTPLSFSLSFRLIHIGTGGSDTQEPHNSQPPKRHTTHQTKMTQTMCRILCKVEDIHIQSKRRIRVRK